MPQLSFIFQLLLSSAVIAFNCSCGLLKGKNNTNDLEIVVSNSTKDSTVIPKKDSVLKPVITKRDSVIWTDTIVESPVKKYVVRYKKYTDAALIRDTIQIIDLSGADITPKKEDQKIISRKKEVYNVALILPFNTNLYNGKSDLPGQSVRAVEFYEGVRIAIDSLEREGAKMQLHVFDSKRDPEELQKVIQKMEGKEWDMIIGPTSTDVLKDLAQYALEKQIPLISPFNNNPEIAKENHYYIQVNPSFEISANYIAALMNQVKIPSLGHLKKTNYLLLGMEEDSLKMEQIQSAYALSKNNGKLRVPQLISNEGISVGSLMKYFDRTALNVIVIPSDKSEQFVFSALREISSLYDKVEKLKGYQFVVVGTPMWKYFERINYEYYDNLRLHIPDNYYVNTEDRKNEQFAEGYRKTYGIAPREFAYSGFDVMLYFGRMLNKYGTAFPEYFPEEEKAGRSTQFKFKPVLKTQKALDGADLIDQQRIERYENSFLNIIKFEEFDFKPVKVEID